MHLPKSWITLFALCISFVNVFCELNLYDYSVTDMQGNIVPLSKYKGKVTLIVNVASHCGYTDNHYRGLTKLQETLGITNRFQVLAFPCNDFGAQEPGTHAEIQAFANKYGANFPIFGKVNVMENAPEFYQYLFRKTDLRPNWNFWKYIVDHNGNVVSGWGPWTNFDVITPMIQEVLEKALKDTIQVQFKEDEAPGQEPPIKDEF